MGSAIYNIRRPFLLGIFFVFVVNICAYAQGGREVDGTVIDSTKLSLKGATIKLISGKGDSSVIVTDSTGKFAFPAVKSNKFTLTVLLSGYQGIERRYGLDTSNKTATLPPIVLTKSKATAAPVAARTQGGREVNGTVIDSTKLTIPGATVKLVSDRDSAVVATDANGKFVFPVVKSNKFSL